jgi:hypothetical protein
MSDEPATWLDVTEMRVRRNLGGAMFTARWILAPIYLGLLTDRIGVLLALTDRLSNGHGRKVARCRPASSSSPISARR